MTRAETEVTQIVKIVLTSVRPLDSYGDVTDLLDRTTTTVIKDDLAGRTTTVAQVVTEVLNDSDTVLAIQSIDEKGRPTMLHGVRVMERCVISCTMQDGTELTSTSRKMRPFEKTPISNLLQVGMHSTIVIKGPAPLDPDNLTAISRPFPWEELQSTAESGGLHEDPPGTTKASKAAPRATEGTKDQTSGQRKHQPKNQEEAKDNLPEPTLDRNPQQPTHKAPLSPVPFELEPEDQQTHKRGPPDEDGSDHEMFDCNGSPSKSQRISVTSGMGSLTRGLEAAMTEHEEIQREELQPNTPPAQPAGTGTQAPAPMSTEMEELDDEPANNEATTTQSALMHA